MNEMAGRGELKSAAKAFPAKLPSGFTPGK
ncbi:hypothetical protein L905_20885 [Agrobacterium sp. TS43]|nr:hypothetical protein L902_08335 [Agrobacterium radiobacter DSM 30147]KVK45908.1 hypothetical protein L904_24510 [Agrobacterium sp. LY4]KVK46027.1 hypothetical protein L903_24650 [Agrobacterium sp. JL28]KVK59553.1 hypothetical protein L906_24230 [Agrobacterium sp. TS45]KVK62559.1 hypothetical protein L905_20885 [Agrobacterium sp. TS43]KVK63875.1 hypothetical protein L907_24180 [Agrobacterium sp. C13]